jgi:hypothetical protein
MMHVRCAQRDKGMSDASGAIVPVELLNGQGTAGEPMCMGYI